MKITSIFLAAVMVSAIAGQAAEARDHDGWRNQQRARINFNKQLRKQQNRAWRNNNWNNRYNGSWNNGYNGWNSASAKRQHGLNIMQAQSQYALQEIRRMQQAQNPGRFWY